MTAWTVEKVMRRFMAMLAILIPALAVGSAASPAFATNSGSHYCLLNATSFCWDVKDDNYVNGQQVWLYDSSQAKALGFQGTIQEFDSNHIATPAGH